MGNYRYSQKIGRGGMAQVYLAIQEGIGGFEKPVVVKRIFAHLCESDHFVKMFLDEARLAATVRHPNVVEIFDIGHDDDGYFMIMEYLSGETLAFVAQTLGMQKRAIPPAIACRIGASVAAGLQYAHQAVDACGKRQPLVHRDVTPSNLMVCYNGAVKILDFGIAKAIESAEETTDAASVKGKLSYLSPEQVNNEPLDARTDVFQLGIVMHEILCGRRLFNARSNHEKIKAVMEREIKPPSAYNPDVPGYLDDVVLAALERDPTRRTQTADEVCAGLEDALERMGEPVSDAKLGSWMRTQFPKAYTERLEMERFAITAARNSTKVITSVRRSEAEGSGHITERISAERGASGRTIAAGSAEVDDDRFSVEAPTPSGNGQSVSAQEPHPGSSVDRLLAMHARAMESDEHGHDEPLTVAIPHADLAPARVETRDKRSRYWLGAGLLAATVAAVAVLFIQLTDARSADERAASGAVLPGAQSGLADPTRADRAAPPASDPRATEPVEPVEPSKPAPARVALGVVTVPEDATLELDGHLRAVGSMFQSIPADDQEHLLVISAPGYETQEVRFTADAPPPSVIRLRRVTTAAGDRDHVGKKRRPGRADKAVVTSPETRTDKAPDAADAPSPRPDQRDQRPAPQHTDNLDPWAE